MLQCPISERLFYLAYIGAVISLPVGEMSHAARRYDNVTVLSGRSSLALSFLASFYANAKQKSQLWFCLFTLSLCLSHFTPFSSILSLPTVFASGEPLPECRRYAQLRNITKGDCRLDNVEVSFCRGRCLSRTDVILEVWRRDMNKHTCTIY